MPLEADFDKEGNQVENSTFVKNRTEAILFFEAVFILMQVNKTLSRILPSPNFPFSDRVSVDPAGSTNDNEKHNGPTISVPCVKERKFFTLFCAKRLLKFLAF